MRTSRASSHVMTRMVGWGRVRYVPSIFGCSRGTRACGSCRFARNSWSKNGSRAVLICCPSCAPVKSLLTQLGAHLHYAQPARFHPSASAAWPPLNLCYMYSPCPASPHPLSRIASRQLSFVGGAKGNELICLSIIKRRSMTCAI